MTGSIQDPHGYLPAVLDQDPTHHHSLALYRLSLDHWPLPSWKVRVLTLGSIAIPLPLQDAAFGALGPQMHHMHAGCPAHDEFICDIVTNIKFSVGATPGSVSGKLPSQ
jgi:hypothetical protein